MGCYILFDKVDGMLEYQDFVAHNHSHQRDDTHDGGQTQRAVHESQADECARNHQSQGCNADGCDAILLEVEQQEEENDDHGDGHTTENLRHGLGVVLYFATHFGAHSFGNADFVLHDVGHTALHGSGIDVAGELCCHRDAAFAATVHDATFAPQGLHVGYLAQRNGGVRAVQS